jgi:Predicted transcriptional regulator with C-terminal CBS domains
VYILTLGERIKKIRKTLDLTQQNFSKQIGTTQNSLTGYETGRRNPSSSVINNICKTFNISEHWLRNGEGKMFTSEPVFDLEEYVKQHGATYVEIEILKAYFDLDANVRGKLLQHFQNKLSAINSIANISISAESIDARPREEKQVKDWTDEDIEDEVEEYRRELIAEKKQAEKLSDLSGTKTKLA